MPEQLQKTRPHRARDVPARAGLERARSDGPTKDHACTLDTRIEVPSTTTVHASDFVFAILMILKWEGSLALSVQVKSSESALFGYLSAFPHTCTRSSVGQFVLNNNRTSFEYAVRNTKSCPRSLAAKHVYQDTSYQNAPNLHPVTLDQKR